MQNFKKGFIMQNYRNLVHILSTYIDLVHILMVNIEKM